MGKLSKIRRAFDNSSEITKKGIWFNNHGCKFLDDGSVYFTSSFPACRSYRRYVAKIAYKWIVETYGHDGEVALRD